MSDRTRPYSSFFWSDYESDEALKQCSLAAQGLWMRMLCVCAKGEPAGYLTIGGRPLDVDGVARACGRSETEVEPLMAELEEWGVFSRDRKGRIYSRRMVRDAQRAKNARKNGSRGGNPTLRKNKENSSWVNPGDNPKVKPQYHSHSQKDSSEASPPRRRRAPPARSPTTPEEPPPEFELTAPEPDPPPVKPHHCPPDWSPTPEDRAMARALGLTDEEIADETAEFVGFWSAQRSAKSRRPGWSATWRTRIRQQANRLGAHRRLTAAGSPRPEGVGVARFPGPANGGRPGSIADAYLRRRAEREHAQHLGRERPVQEPGDFGDDHAGETVDGVFRVVGG